MDDDDEDTLNADLELRRRHHDSILSFVALQFDDACLEGLDDALLLAPVDSFADLCYSTCMSDTELNIAQLLSWQRRVSRLHDAHDLSPSPRSELKDLFSDDSESSDSDSDSLTTPTDGADARQWRARRDAKGSKRVAFAPLPAESDTPTKSGVTLPLEEAPAFCDPEATMAFLLSSLPADPKHSVHYFPTWVEKRPPEKSSIKHSVMRGLAGLRAGWAR